MDDSELTGRRVALQRLAGPILSEPARGDRVHLSLRRKAIRSGRACAEAGLGDERLLDLRDNYAPHTVMNGVPVPVVSRLLGHSSVRTSLRYIHLDEHDIREAAERIVESRASVMAAGTVPD